MRSLPTRTTRVRASGRRAGGGLLSAVVAVLVLAGCTAQPGASATSSPPISGSPTASPRPAAVFHPDGSAADNLPLFREVVARVWASPQRVSGAAYVDALSAAGFARADMQRTADESTVGNPAESLQFSVRWGATECLVGQVGPSTGDPVTAVLPQLAGGRCLIGKTEPIEG